MEIHHESHSIKGEQGKYRVDQNHYLRPHVGQQVLNVLPDKCVVHNRATIGPLHKPEAAIR